MIQSTISQRPTSMDDVFTYHVRSEMFTAKQRGSVPMCSGPACSDSGILEHDVVDGLKGFGVTEGRICFLTLVPLAHVAWADAGITSVRRQKILARMEREGLNTSSMAYRLLTAWLTARPEQSLFHVWCDYIAALQRIMPADIFRSMRNSITSAAECCAQSAASGFGLLNEVRSSTTELQQVLEAFEAA